MRLDTYKTGSHRNQAHYPLAALLARAGAISQSVLADRLAIQPRTVNRWATHGIPESSADPVATALGFHPFEVWGDAWLAGAETNELPS